MKKDKNTNVYYDLLQQKFFTSQKLNSKEISTQQKLNIMIY